MIQGVSYWRMESESALMGRMINNFIELWCLVALGGVDICVSLTSIQKKWHWLASICCRITCLIEELDNFLNYTRKAGALMYLRKPKIIQNVHLYKWICSSLETLPAAVNLQSLTTTLAHSGTPVWTAGHLLDALQFHSEQIMPPKITLGYGPTQLMQSIVQPRLAGREVVAFCELSQLVCLLCCLPLQS